MRKQPVAHCTSALWSVGKGKPSACNDGIFFRTIIMAFIAKDSGGGDFKRVPPGAYIGRCFSLVDLGTQLSSGQYGEKMLHKIRIGWELFGDDEAGNPLTIDVDGKMMPLTISKSYTMSLGDKANLRRDLAAWRGKDFTDEEAKGFDVSKLLNVYCMVNATQSETNGKTYTNVAGITPLPGALRNAKPAPVHPVITFDLDAPDMKVFDTFHEKLQNAIKASPEWQKLHKQAPAQSGPPAGHPAAASGFDQMDDDIPF
jgi:hypothetical protein